MVKLGKYSIGMGDRFAHQGQAQLKAVMKAADEGIEVTAVWNKSHREHKTVGSEPSSVRREADSAVRELGYKGAYFVDADHIGLQNVELFMDWCDFFTLDVAEEIGGEIEASEIEEFVKKYSFLAGRIVLPVLESELRISEGQIRAAAEKFLPAVRQAGRIYRRIKKAKADGNFVTEVSMDETDSPQSPVEMLLILAAIAEEGIEARTIAPKFTGRFNKGVDYVGDVKRFANEFEMDLAVLEHARKNFRLPGDLKLSVHSGSDKFSIYAPINAALKKFDAGLHVKTAGTTWLEELIGLAEAGGEGLEIVKEIYRRALGRFDELCGPYATVIDIDRGALASAEMAAGWSSKKFADRLRHEPGCSDYDPNLRQLMHVSYKIAAEMGETFTGAIEKYRQTIADNVTNNILKRHIKPIFGKESR